MYILRIYTYIKSGDCAHFLSVYLLVCLFSRSHQSTQSSTHKFKWYIITFFLRATLLLYIYHVIFNNNIGCVLFGSVQSRERDPERLCFTHGFKMYVYCFVVVVAFVIIIHPLNNGDSNCDDDDNDDGSPDPTIIIVYGRRCNIVNDVVICVTVVLCIVYEYFG